MKTLLLIYHSQSGNTAKLARAVIEGVKKVDGVCLSVLPAFEASTKDLVAADGVLFGSPENLGYMSGALKDFFDRTLYPSQPYELNLPYALFISAGNDGSGAVREVDRILKGYPLKKATEAIIVKGEVREEDLASCRSLGEAFASGLVMGIF